MLQVAHLVLTDTMPAICIPGSNPPDYRGIFRVLDSLPSASSAPYGKGHGSKWNSFPAVKDQPTREGRHLPFTGVCTEYLEHFSS